MTMEGSAQIGPIEQRGEPPVFRRFELTTIFAQLRLDVGEAQRAINVWFRVNFRRGF